LLFSSLQAHLFNRVLALRQRDGIWATPLLGDLVKKRDTGGIFECADPTADCLRAEAGQVSPTGPIFGLKMRRPSGKPDEIEREILLGEAGAADAFDRHRHLGEGSRRPLRLIPEEVRAFRPEEEPGVVRVYFVLPKGGYATTVLAQAVTLVTDDPKSDDIPLARPPFEGAEGSGQDNAELLEDISG
jgi:tRNA pseudouridine13 synthase